MNRLKSHSYTKVVQARKPEEGDLRVRFILVNFLSFFVLSGFFTGLSKKSFQCTQYLLPYLGSFMRGVSVAPFIFKQPALETWRQIDRSRSSKTSITISQKNRLNIDHLG